MNNKIKLNLNYLRPGCNLIYPLYTEDGEKIIDDRVILTQRKIDEIKKKYGDIVYYHDSDAEIKNELTIPREHITKAVNNSRSIIEEIRNTDKLSKSAYREAENVVEDIVSDLNSNELEAIKLLKELKSHEDYLYQHSVNVGMLSAIFAMMTGAFTKEEIKHLTLGAYLLDIGSIKIEKKILQKSGRFNSAEKLAIKQHPQLGYDIVKSIPGIDKIVLQTMLFHHEKMYNRGYFHLPYEILPISPKFVSVCDIYDALTTKRPFRDPISPTKALRFLVNSINEHFDYKLISDFINKLGPMLNNTQSFFARNEYCELNTGELAVIMDFGMYDFLKPKVMVFCKFKKKKNKLTVQFYDRPIEVNLQEDNKRLLTKIIDNRQHIIAIKAKLIEKDML